MLKSANNYQHREAKIFVKAVLKETIQILPKMPLTSSMAEMTQYLNNNLPFNSEQVRARRGRYIKFNMFHEHKIDMSLLIFARNFPNSRELQDVCFYQFCRAQALMVDFIENVILDRISVGFISREMITEYLRSRFPDSKVIHDGTSAICEALLGAEIANKKKNHILFSYRSIPLKAFSFILHSEFPNPGIYDIRMFEENRMIRAMLWSPEKLLHSLYELRNMGLISRISEIDNVRQFTTKLRLDESVTRITS